MIYVVGRPRHQTPRLDSAYVRWAGQTRRVEILAIPPLPERQGLVKVLSIAWWLDLLAGGPLEWFEGVGERGSRQTRVVVRYHEREHLLFEETSFESAKSKCERVAQEYESMDWHAWCHRYRPSSSSSTKRRGPLQAADTARAGRRLWKGIAVLGMLAL